MLIRPLANIFSLPPFPLIPFLCLPNPLVLSFSPPGLPLIPFWVIELTQHFQRSAWALTTHVKVPLLSKLTQPHPHTTCMSATLHSSPSARSHRNYNRPNWGPTIKIKRSNHYQQVGMPTPALQAQPCWLPFPNSIPSISCKPLFCSPKP